MTPGLRYVVELRPARLPYSGPGRSRHWPPPLSTFSETVSAHLTRPCRGCRIAWRAFFQLKGAFLAPKTSLPGGECYVLFEVETTSHIMIASVDDEAAARSFVPGTTIPTRKSSASAIVRGMPGSSPRTFSALPVRSTSCTTARDGFAKAQGDKLHAVRLPACNTREDLEGARKVIESNMAMGW